MEGDGFVGLCGGVGSGIDRHGGGGGTCCEGDGAAAAGGGAASKAVIGRIGGGGHEPSSAAHGVVDREGGSGGACAGEGIDQIGGAVFCDRAWEDGHGDAGLASWSHQAIVMEGIGKRRNSTEQLCGDCAAVTAFASRPPGDDGAVILQGGKGRIAGEHITHAGGEQAGHAGLVSPVGSIAQDH